PLYAATLRAQGEGDRIGSVVVAASVEAEKRNASVSARATGIQLPKWLPYVPANTRLPARIERGSLDVEATALVTGGKLLDYHGSARLRQGRVRVPQLRAPIREIEVAARFTPSSVVVDTLRARSGSLLLTGRASALGVKDPWVTASLSTGPLREADIRALVPSLPRLPDIQLGKIERVEVVAVGPLSQLQARVNLDLSRVDRPEAGLSDIHLAARAVGRQHVVVESFTARVAGGTLAAKAQIDLSGKEPRYTARGSLRGLDLRALRLKKYLEGDPPAGVISADFQAEGAGARPRVRARIDADSLQWKGWGVDKAQVQAAYADGKVAVEHAQVLAPEGALVARGEVDLKGPLHLEVSAQEIDLTAIGRKLGQEKVRGNVYVRGSVTGTLKEPSF
ncbi:MAG: DUF748 domain-containing protein, partial [Armatimonadota bacterium]|nr:DUF748 domain-containing protein [Armatimonadota bacterium]